MFALYYKIAPKANGPDPTVVSPAAISGRTFVGRSFLGRECLRDNFFLTFQPRECIEFETQTLGNLSKNQFGGWWHDCWVYPKARGKSLGRPFKLTVHQRQEARARREGGALLSEIARRYHIRSSTISRLVVRNQRPPLLTRLPSTRVMPANATTFPARRLKSRGYRHSPA